MDVPLSADWFQLVVTLFSFKMLSATRAASALRVPISPARLAMCSASTATGMTMAMNNIAASTSASVKAEARCLAVAIANFIVHAIGRLKEPENIAVLRSNPDRRRTGFINGSVRLKPNRCHASPVHSHLRRVHRFDLQRLVEIEFFGFRIGILRIAVLRTG